jgi:hypothetical protein
VIAGGLTFLIGVYRAWDLVGGPSFDVGREVRSILDKPGRDVRRPPGQAG